MRAGEASSTEWAWWEHFDWLSRELIAAVLDQELAKRHDGGLAMGETALRALDAAAARENATRDGLWEHAQLGIQRGYLRTRTLALD